MHFLKTGVLCILIVFLVMQPAISNNQTTISDFSQSSDNTTVPYFPEINTVFSQENQIKMPLLPRFYRDTLPDEVEREWICLSWNNMNNPHIITIYSPEKSIGSFQNIDDGRRDGRIYLEISSDYNLTPGTWYYVVRDNGSKSNGNDSFRIYRDKITPEI